MALATPTTRFARRQADRLFTDLRKKLAGTAKSADPDSVHDLRVAIRRFQQVLTVFKPAFPAHQRKKIRKKLKQVMQPAGEVRNCDIAAILIPKLDPKHAPQLGRKVQKERETAGRDLAQSLSRLMDRELPARWRAALELYPTPARNGWGGQEIPQAMQRKVAQMAAKFLALGRKATHPDTSAQDVHRFRIASKKFRYTLELVDLFRGAGLTSWLERVKAVQSVLGDANDCEIVRQMVERWNGEGELIAKLEKRQKRKLMKFRREWAAMPEAGAFPAMVSAKSAVKDIAPRRGVTAATSSRNGPSRNSDSRSAVA